MNKLITNKITLIIFTVIICHFTAKAQDSAKKVIVVVRPGGIIWTPAITAPARIPANSAASPTLLASNSAHLAAVPATTPAKPASTSVVLASNRSHLAAVPATTPAKPASTPVLLASNSSHLAAVPATTGDATPATVAQKSTSATPTYAAAAPKPVVTTASNLPAAQTTVATVVPASSLPAAQKTVASVTPPVQKPVVQYVAPGSRPTGYIAPSMAERTGTASYMRHAVVPVTPSATPVLASIAPVKSAPITKFIDTNKMVIALDTPVKVVVRPGKTDTISKTDTVLITKLKTDTVDSAALTAKHRSNKILFAELGGPGLAISLNYDQRFKKGSKDGFGFRVGVGYFAAGNNTVFTVPIMVNYLIGKDGKYIELGLGTTFLNSKGDNYSSSVWEFDDVTGFIATAVIGVRYEPNKALNFRLGYVPILYDEGLINAGGFSIGYTF